jgi:uncharacterized membrane protein
MTERVARTAIAILALVGACIAGYLLYERYTGGTILCTSGGCETVQHSRYARVAGVPVALIGLAGYVGLFASALVRGEVARAAGVMLAVCAVLFGAYLLVVQVVAIHAICIWCVASDMVVTLIALLTLARAYLASRDRATLAASV